MNEWNHKVNLEYKCGSCIWYDYNDKCVVGCKCNHPGHQKLKTPYYERTRVGGKSCYTRDENKPIIVESKRRTSDRPTYKELEKALDKACDILKNERIICYKDCPFEHERNRNGTCKGLCESKSNWKEWLLKDE